MYSNAQRQVAALGVRSMFLPTPYGGSTTEWVNKGVKGNKDSQET